MAYESQPELHCPRPNGEAPIPLIPDHELLRRIGRGSYGEVWLARNAVGTWRAVKVVYRDHFKEAHPYEREFNGIRKYEPISRTHEGLMDVLQIGRNEAAGYFYYVMELADDASRAPGPEPADEANLLSGVWSYVPRTLASEIRARGRLPVQECLTLGLTLSLALEHLHRHGLIHRDVKPSNIVFVNGIPRLADIGLVTQATEAESFVGTEGFIPPEGPTSAQSDIYALGKVLYEASMGKDRQQFPEPFSGLGTDSESRVLMELNAILLRACARSTRERYGSAGQMHADLALLHSGQSVKQKHALERRVKLLSRAAVGIAAALVLGVAPYYWVLREARVAHAEAARARVAETESKQQLWRAYLAEARAGRWSHQAGRRFEGLELLKRAAAIRPSPELRNEAIACMALTDFRIMREWNVSQPEAALAFDSTYEQYAVNDTQGTIHIRRIADQTEVTRFDGYSPQSQFKTISFSPDHQFLLVASVTGGSNRIRLLDLADGSADLESERDYRTSAFSADGRWLAIAYNEPTNGFPISIFDLSLGREIASFRHGTLPFILQFNPQHPMLLLSSDDTPTVRVWEWDAGQMTRSFPHPDWVEGVAWDTGGERLAAACGDKQVYLWDLVSGQRQTTLAGHEWAAVRVTFSRDGQFLASRGWDGLLCVWDPRGGRELVNRLLAGTMFDFSQTGPQLGVWVGEGKVALLEVAAGSGYRVLRSDVSANDMSSDCEFSPDGRFLVSSDLEGTSFWDVETGKEVARLSRPSPLNLAKFLRGGSNLVLRTEAGMERWRLEAQPSAGICTLHSEGKLETSKQNYEAPLGQKTELIAEVRGRLIHLVDAATGVERRVIKLPYRPLYPVLNADGTRMATWPGAGTNVQIWDLATSNLLHVVPAHLSIQAAFSPDGRRLAVGDREEYRVWDTASWQPLYQLARVPADFFGFLAFSGDSRLLAVAISRSSVRLVEAGTGTELATLEPPQRMDIHWLAMDRDGARLAALSGSGPIQLWDLRQIRQQLAAMHLDWQMPPYPSRRAVSGVPEFAPESRARLAMRLDGKTACLALPNLTVSAPQGTIELWFKPDAWDWANAPDGLYLWSGVKGAPGSSAGDGINLGTHSAFGHDGELMFGIFEKEWHWARSGVVPALGRWQHIAASWGAGGLRLYINGKLSGGDPYNGPAPWYSVTNLLGCSSWPGSFFHGQIDEVRLWSIARDEAEIQGDMHQPVETPQPHLQGYWRFDGQGSPVRARDHSGRGHSGILAGGATFVPSTAPVESGRLLARRGR